MFPCFGSSMLGLNCTFFSFLICANFLVPAIPPQLNAPTANTPNGIYMDFFFN